MKTVSKRELNQQTAKVLADVVDGETIVVTERGVVRWRIESTEHPVDPIALLEAEGRIMRAKADPAPWPEPDGDPRAQSWLAIHLATCRLLGPDVTVVTHDAAMAQAAQHLGFDTTDPIGTVA